MADFTVPPNCYSVKMLDGTVYRANRRGKVEIDNPRHITETRGSSAKKGLDMIKDSTWTSPQGTPSITCKCHFEAWAWSVNCPRCGTKLVKETQANE